jgi:hypothetical protein
MDEDESLLGELLKALRDYGPGLLYFLPMPHPADPIGDACCQAIERIATPPSTPKE